MGNMKSVTEQELNELILDAEQMMIASEMKLWECMKIPPERWKEKKCHNDRTGFWVVAIIGRSVVYFNDIESGFVSSGYTEYGVIDSYVTNEVNLTDLVRNFSSYLTE